MALRREDDKLRLDLSLFSGNHYDLRPNLSAEPPFSASVRPPADEFSSEIRNSGTYRVEARTFLKNIDVNRVPELDGFNDEEEEEGVATSPTASSPSSTVSNHSLNGTKRGLENDSLLEEERPSSRGGNTGSDEEDAFRKKLRLSKEQSAVLEESFKGHPTLNPKQKVALAKQLNLRPRQVEVWFQNRRARTKLKQTEVDCEFLKRCCENLTEENRRLQRELQELRALKLSPQFYMPVPATTLTMCPSCEKFTGVAATSVAGNNCHIPPSAVVPFQMRGFDMPSRSR